ncbi:MAG: hypothetical protein JJU11_07495, partial [Candidatus Sumerlaeia bacterium]|nr:hypothetical protein [Candidatus Sumerlaeia bacterium]
GTPSERYPMKGKWTKHPLIRLLRMGALTIIGFSLLFSGCLLVFQRHLVFPGAMLLQVELDNLPDGVERLEHVTNEGRQFFYYIGPRNGQGELPSPLWVCFHGNASAALHWVDFLGGYPDEQAGFLLLDYPGYIENEGRPSPRSIRESANSALAKVAEHLDTDVETIQGDLAVLGFSIGTGGAFDFAARQPVHTVVACSPFSSLLDMARRTTFWPFYHLLLYRYDNVARLEELYSRDSPPRVAIIHGSNDEIIPVEHSRRMVEKFPQIEYHEVHMGDHNHVLFSSRQQIWEAMMRE